MGLLGDCGELAAAQDAGAGPMAPKPPHFPGKAKRVVHFFLNGGPSHVDTFDPKPALAKYAGKPVPNTLTTERKTGAAFPSPFKFRKYGQSGIEVSELFAETARHVDDIAVIRSMKAAGAEPRAVADADELRRLGPAPPERRGVGAVRAGDREPEPARVRRHVPRRLPDQGERELAVGVPARGLPGHLRRLASTRRSTS